MQPASIHQGYLLDHDEKLGRTVITAQFRFAGAKGTTLVLNPPSRFLLDGKEATITVKEKQGLIQGSEDAVLPLLEITEAQMDWIAARYQDCLCPVCLQLVADGKLGPEPMRPMS